MTNADKLNALSATLDALAPQDRAFAISLINQAGKRGLSDKQWFWVGKLAARAAGQDDAPKAQAIGDMKGVVALLNRAAKHLKRPAVVLRANNRSIRLSIAGARARVPGSVNVCSTGGFDDREWYGRVTVDGTFEPSRKYDDATLTAVAGALRALAADPAKAAAEHGHLTGACCFCNRLLEDERSTEVGYGPVCARHFGLPWGVKLAEAA